MYKSAKDMLKHTTDLARQLKEAKKKEVAIGLPTEKATGKVYKNGNTIINVGARHEYGIGLPRRSFLRLPLEIKKKDLGEAIKKEYGAVIEKNKNVTKALGLIGAQAYNIIQKGFLTEGFGQWEQLSVFTIEEKRSSKILIDTGILKNSITWAVRDVT